MGLVADTISAGGDGEGEISDPYLIGVSGVTDTTFSLMATFSQVRSPVPPSCVRVFSERESTNDKTSKS